jgi:hypothetical protein
MTTSPLQAALLAHAEGLYALEAATGLIIVHGILLARPDFGSFIHRGLGTAANDRDAAIAALDAGGLPCSAGERRMLRLEAGRPHVARRRGRRGTLIRLWSEPGLDARRAAGAMAGG